MKLLLFSIIIFWKFSISLNLSLSKEDEPDSQVKFGYKNEDKLTQIINHFFKTQPMSVTFLIPVINFKIFPLLRLKLISENSLILGNEFPRSKRVSTKFLIHFSDVFYNLIAIFWIENIQKEKEKIKFILQDLISRRRHRVIFIAEKEADLEEFYKEKLFNELKMKIGLSLSTNLIFCDPFVYNKGIPRKIDQIDEIIEGNPYFGGNLRGRHFQIAGAEFPTWVYKKGELGNKAILAGNYYNSFLEASKIFNFTFDTHYTGTNYGQLLPNGTWIGMYGFIFYPEKGYQMSFFLCHCYDWAYGADFPSYSLTISTADLIFVTGHPQKLLKWYSFVLPLSLTVWIYFLVIFTFIAILTFLIMFFINKCEINFSVWNSGLFLPFAIILEQSLYNIPKGIRFLSIILLLLGSLVGTSYRSNLRANLAIQKLEEIPRTFDELANRIDEYEVSLYTQGVVETTYFKTATVSSIVKIRKRLRFEEDGENCIRKAFMDEKGSCIAWSPLIEQIVAKILTINTKFEALEYSKDAALKVTESIGFQKDSQYADSFFGIFSGATEGGIFKKWEKEVNYEFKQIGIANVSSNKNSPLYRKLVQVVFHRNDKLPLTVYSLRGVFLLVPCGLLLALIVCLMELFYFNRNQIDLLFKLKKLKKNLRLINGQNIEKSISLTNLHVECLNRSNFSNNYT